MANAQITLFRVSKDKLTKKLEREAAESKKPLRELNDNNAIVDFLMTSKKAPYNEFDELKLKPGFGDGFNVRVFYQLISLPAKWTEFFRPIVDDSETDFFTDLARHKSFIGFVFKDDELFAFSGGLGSHVIRDYVDDDFGLSVLIRLLNKDDVKLKRIINRAMTGNELASDRVFKADYRIGNEDNFGKIYRSLHSHLSKKVLKESLGLTERKKDRGSTVIARSSFQIGRAISAGELIQLIKRIEIVLTTEPLFELNNIRQITGRKFGDKELIAELDARLTQEVFLAFKHGKLSIFEIFHREVERFLEATVFYIKRGSHYLDTPIEGLRDLTAEKVFDLLQEDRIFMEKASAYDPDEIDLDTDDGRKAISDLHAVLQRFKIEAENSEEEQVSCSSVFDHIQGEIDIEGAKYFRLEGSWYAASEGFITDVDSACSELIEQVSVNDLLSEPWHHGVDDENSYMEKYLEEKHRDVVFPLHKVIHDQTELCDLLIKKDKAIYFVHIKQGFDGSVRDLISQVHLSAKLFISAWSSEAKWEEKPFVQGYFEKVKKFGGKSSYAKKMRQRYKTMQKRSFAKLFDDAQSFNFVFAIYDDAKTVRELPKDLKKFKSAIAKMSLVNLERDIARISQRASSLKFVQIRRA